MGTKDKKINLQLQFLEDFEELGLNLQHQVVHQLAVGPQVAVVADQFHLA